jgi:hypothetical protein
MTFLLPSRATAPERCEECDDDRDGEGPLCIECAGASYLQRLDWRYQNGEGVVPWFDNDRWRIGREFHPLTWQVSVGVQFDHCGAAVWIEFGPWTLTGGWSA